MSLNEDEIGVDSPDGGVGLVCKVSANSGDRKVQRTTRVSSSPGSVVRVSVSFPGHGRDKASARILAYIDPITGNGVVRLGMFNTSKSTSGKEEGKQVVWETDTPVWRGNAKG